MAGGAMNHRETPLAPTVEAIDAWLARALRRQHLDQEQRGSLLRDEIEWIEARPEVLAKLRRQIAKEVP